MFAGLCMLLVSCQGDEIVEPNVYTAKQIRRLLFGVDGTKLWEQSSAHYQEDSCRTGYLLAFTDNEKKDLAKPFNAYFYRDPLSCQAGTDTVLQRPVNIRITPPYQTTDRLEFIMPLTDSAWILGPGLDSTLLVGAQADSAWLVSPERVLWPAADTTVGLIKLLTSQQMLLELTNKDGDSHEEAYRAVGVGVEEE